MRTLLLAFLLLAGSATAVAAPAPLPDRQLDRVVAGALAPVGPTAPFNPGGPMMPVYPAPPIINPGGPVLISCIVGVGCTTRHFR